MDDLEKWMLALGKTMMPEFKEKDIKVVVAFANNVWYVEVIGMKNGEPWASHGARGATLLKARQQLIGVTNDADTK